MSETSDLVEVVDDPLYLQTVQMVGGFGRFRLNRLQHLFNIGFNRASRIMDRLKEAGLIVAVGPEGGGYYEPAPKPGAEVQLGKFGHHPSPALDFMLEVEAIENELVDLAAGLAPTMDLPARVAAALEFKVGGDPGAVAAKNGLRALVAERAKEQAFGTGQKEVLLNPLDLVALARESGLRGHLHGLNTTDCRVLLGRFVAALDAARQAGASQDLALERARRLHAASEQEMHAEHPVAWDLLCPSLQAHWLEKSQR